MPTKKNKLPGFVADSYFDSSKIILNQLIPYINKNQPLKDVVSPYHLLYPAIFNFKNGIELWQVPQILDTFSTSSYNV
ncbi:MAG: hypothetical protein WCJ57_03585, partial [Candidatus Falkowbacteria bacterium]